MPRFRLLLVGILTASLPVSLSAAESTRTICQPPEDPTPCALDQYDESVTTGENAIAITEFNISEFQPDRRCPNGGRYHDQIQMQVGTDLPLWFWMRLQGDSSLITRLIARKVTSLPIRATLEVQVAPNTYKPLPGKESVDLTGPLKLDDEVRNEARNSCVKTQEGDGLFDYRMPFYKISGLDDRGGYRVKIEVLESTVSVICNNSVVCEQDRTDGPFWLTFLK